MRKPRKASIALKQDILAVAERLFKEYGYDQTTMQMIADELHIVQGTLTYHFQNKYKILFEVFKNLITNIEQYVHENLEEGHNHYLCCCAHAILFYRQILTCESNWRLFLRDDMTDFAIKNHEPFLKITYMSIMGDFRKAFTEDDLKMIVIVDYGARRQMNKKFMDGEITADEYCRYYIYLMGLLSKLDEATIERNIREAFAFADSHVPPSTYMLE